MTNWERFPRGRKEMERLNQIVKAKYPDVDPNWENTEDSQDYLFIVSSGNKHARIQVTWEDLDFMFADPISGPGIQKAIMSEIEKGLSDPSKGKIGFVKD